MFQPLPQNFRFPEQEKRILAFWDENTIFQKSLDARKDAPRFVFYEGPPTANGMPHPGHALTRAMKDIFPRYQTMCGKLVERKAGWDTHGLPVEREVCRELSLKTKQDIENYGVEKFNLKCIQSVFRYTREWEELTRRVGFWVNLSDAYVTFHQSYVESVWWSLKTLFERKDAQGRPLLYQRHKVVWWWAQGGTALSAGEVGEGYKDVDDPSVFVKFPLEGDSAQKIMEAIGELSEKGSIGVSPVRHDETTQSHQGVARTPVTSQLHKRGRILPHWEAGGSTYFITFRVFEGTLSTEERTVVLDACRHWDSQRMTLHAAAVMPDHVHLLCTPSEKAPGEWWSLADIMHSIKGFSAKTINQLRGTAGLIWQREYFDRIIRTESDFDEKWNYIVHNPELGGAPDTYPWLWVESSHSVSHRRDADAPLTTDAASASHRPGGDASRISLLVWTTTPWTLISNHFAAVNAELEYALVEDAGPDGGAAGYPEYLIVASALVEQVGKKVKRELKVVRTILGRQLGGLRYLPCYKEAYYEQSKWIFSGLGPQWGPAFPANPTANVKCLGELTAPGIDGDARHIGWRTLTASFVTIDSGTGIVHEAPAFGEVDFDLLQQERAWLHNPEVIPLLCAVHPDGTFNVDAPERYRGRWVKDCDKDIIRELRDERKTPWGTPLLFHQETYHHPYPFCPQAPDDPLIQYPRTSWFVRTSEFKQEFLKNNFKVNWLPREGIGGDETGKGGRFGDFLANNVDWALSRERYWGTPLPIWRCEATGQMEAIGSFTELTGKPGATDGGYWDRKVAEHKGEPFPEHLRVHKPYIDEWTYDSPFQSGARMRRVPEVIDCWWDAGSMPFAQWGYPHKPTSRELVSERIPADFISEAIDQTRGWFYALLAINTMLFAEGSASILPASAPRSAADTMPAFPYPIPFRTCIVLGHMLGEDGQKMSKKLRNYREPTYVFDEYGADAMRWYFYSAQSPWTSVRFQEAAIRDSQREFLVKLYNVLSFFTIYASIDGFDPRIVGNVHFADAADPRVTGGGDRPANTPVPMGWRPSAERSELDRWIITELRRTVTSVRTSMDRFENFPAAQTLNEFVESLSNWFVRRSRDRFWRPIENAELRTQIAARGASAPAAVAKHSPLSKNDQDKFDAYHTLYGCLRVFSRLIAPFTPFFAETMHQMLRIPEDPISVHLCDYPTPEEIRFHDDTLSADMSLVRDVVSLGRAARSAGKLKVRQPLAQVEIILARPQDEAALRRHLDLIAEELNVKGVEFTSDADHYVSYKVAPNFAVIGKKFRGLAQAIKPTLAALEDPAAARSMLTTTGRLPLVVNGESIELTAEEVEIRLEAKPGWSAAQGRAGVVVLSTEISPELREEGVIRELIHHVQGLRKEHNLAYQARVALFIAGDAAFTALVQKHFDGMIRGECLAERLEIGMPPGTNPTAVDVEGSKVELAIEERKNG